MKFFNDLKDALSSVVKETPTIRATMMGPRAVVKQGILLREQIYILDPLLKV